MRVFVFSSSTVAHKAMQRRRHNAAEQLFGSADRDYRCDRVRATVFLLEPKAIGGIGIVQLGARVIVLVILLKVAPKEMP